MNQDMYYWKKKPLVVIKKVHSPNALMSRLTVIVINAFLSLYVEPQVINQRKISKKTWEVVIEKFQPNWSELFHYATC